MPTYTVTYRSTSGETKQASGIEAISIAHARALCLIHGRDVAKTTKARQEREESPCPNS
jgi:hypothetical protein